MAAVSLWFPNESEDEITLHQTTKFNNLKAFADNTFKLVWLRYSLLSYEQSP